MPTCDPILLTPITNLILQKQPQTFLDLGMGTGKWGALAREYTDIWHRRLNRDTWKTKITGIEIFEAYRGPLWNVYDSIIIGDIREHVGALPKFDAILFLEVLEHFSIEDGQQILAWAVEHCQYLFFSFTNSLQDAAFGNEAERHISTWSKSMVPSSKLLVATKNTEVYLHENRTLDRN